MLEWLGSVQSALCAVTVSRQLRPQVYLRSQNETQVCTCNREAQSGRHTRTAVVRQVKLNVQNTTDRVQNFSCC